MTYGDNRDQNDTAVIREVYESENALEAFELELDRALEAGCNVIVIEPTRLADETAQWIAFGNFLHRTAVFSGVGAIFAGYLLPKKPIIFGPLCAVSFLSAGLHTVAWQMDPCCKYQICNNSKKLANLPLYNSITPVVLTRQDDTHRRILQSTVTILSVAFCLWKYYQSMK
ncbi:unnamed protein product [Bemisia tabaci]|uniref:Transmembrane protein 11 n=1 Tax=Bemisia tabaci TaxID=7038 RepID=A0A9P0A3G0_BEMTA|nr:PREDICTED: transmembrane protein 11 homolog, mitochondrial [Bemisia tabaci]CAH0382389.1 unnamed protein product [Bemisia tabaci]